MFAWKLPRPAALPGFVLARWLAFLLSTALLAGCAGAAPIAGQSLGDGEAQPQPQATSAEPSQTRIARTPTALPALDTPTPDPTSPLPSPRSTEMEIDFPLEQRYISVPGDTLMAIAGRYGVSPLEIRCQSNPPGYCLPEAEPDMNPQAYAGFSPDRLLPTGTQVFLPEFPQETGPAIRLLPDSEVIYSASGQAFDLYGFVDQAGGTLAGHRQYLMLNAWNSGADIVQLVSIENSINPRLLLALLEYQCRCVMGINETPEPFMGVQNTLRQDLYGQLIWTIFHLSNGYYGWRQGTISQVTLADGSAARLHPALNPGTAALYQVFAQLFPADAFWQALDPESGFIALYRQLFGDPWQYETPIYTPEMEQPTLALPFEPGLTWAYTGGPHPAYEGNGPFASLDFAPATADPGCQPTQGWVTAMADGPVVRSEYGLVIQDLDGDGSEQTGWNIMYLHIGKASRVAVGTYLLTGDRIGQPTCEGGVTTGTHLHIARKFNGEWIPAGSGPLPFNLDGWIARDGQEVYKGTLERDGISLIACTCSWRNSWIEND
jgi:hypothetical protein